MKRAEYLAYLKSPAWQEKRRQAFLANADPRCYCCNRRHSDRRPLDLHHVTYQHLGHEFPNELVLVCRICHDLIHQFADFGAPLGQATDKVRAMRSGPEKQLKPKYALHRHPRSRMTGRQILAGYKEKYDQAQSADPPPDDTGMSHPHRQPCLT